MRRLVTACAVLLLAGSAASAEDGPRFLNRTGQTIVKMYLAAAGTKNWGADQCKNDDEGMVDHNERMTLVGVKSGRYDIKLSEQNGRTCFAKNIELKEGAQFVVRDTDLTECSK
ncbi:conserved exported protein of unknown function [Bradyrhizobium sp. ORS 285]|uniref:hypothetical protein n=1 Tax=Bradyrhizobium sp. ORS 285 TaxID=115808 RepID=UPI00024061E9|nr:hypothetical protein [Bradyrhizobium sp. ORS 285]CCD87155.1 conserved exported hypothetical protein [Bradyrhizobium sp. ORS 285]SMX60183.1 conserved exported protein of unknown function [Bradyrhizobium sp. ORS 285]